MNRKNTQEVCPWNAPKLVELTKERDYRADWREAEDRPDARGDLPGAESPSLVKLMRMTREELVREHAAWALESRTLPRRSGPEPLNRTSGDSPSVSRSTSSR